MLTKLKKDEEHTLTFTIPLFEPLPPCYFVTLTLTPNPNPNPDPNTIAL
jgi:hypothetical protein